MMRFTGKLSGGLRKYIDDLPKKEEEMLRGVALDIRDAAEANLPMNGRGVDTGAMRMALYVKTHAFSNYAIGTRDAAALNPDDAALMLPEVADPDKDTAIVADAMHYAYWVHEGHGTPSGGMTEPIPYLKDAVHDPSVDPAKHWKKTP